MRILLTGCRGQVGSAIAQGLHFEAEVHAPDRTALDLANPDQLRRVLNSLSPELIINTAAYTAVDQAEDEVDACLIINARAPEIMAAYAETTGAGLIHYSTDYVFDGQKRHPYREDDQCHPLNHYGLTKWEGERALAASTAAYFIFRTSWVYAPYGKNFFRTMVRLMREKTELKIVDDQHGAPTSALDLAEWTIQIIRRIQTNGLKWMREHAGIYNMTNGGETTWHGFASAIQSHLRQAGIAPLAKLIPISAEQYPTRATRPAYSVLDNRKLQATFGLSLPSWSEGLQEVWRHYCKLEKQSEFNS